MKKVFFLENKSAIIGKEKMRKEINKGMLTVYIAPSCTSCKKAKSWFEYHNIPYKEHNIISNPLTPEEILDILRKCDGGVEDLLSSRNRFVKDMEVNFEELPLSEAIKIISEHPQILRRPIITDEKRLHVGYNEEEIRTFLPRTVRVLEKNEARLRGAM